MRKLIKLIKKYSDFLLFLLLESVAVLLIIRGTYYQHSRIVNLNREIAGFLYNMVDGTREYLSLRKANQMLVEENTELRNKIESLSGLIDSSKVYRIPADGIRYFFVPATVVHSSVYKQYNFLTLDRGRKHGIFKDMGVISDQGLVGIVLESSKNFSTVLPIVNRDFRLSAKIKSNNYAGILVWEGGSPSFASLNEIPYHVSLSRGDTIVTSGYSAIFPEGLLVGTIEDYSIDRGNFYNVTIRLSTNFQQLFHVNVIRNYYQDEQKQLERELTE